MTTNDVPSSDDQSQLGDVAAPRSGPDTSLGPVWVHLGTTGHLMMMSLSGSLSIIFLSIFYYGGAG